MPCHSFGHVGSSCLGLIASIWILTLFVTISSAYTPLSDDFLRRIPEPTLEDFNIENGRLLAPLLIPRVVGTEGQTRAQRHFVDFFQNNLPQWEMIWQNSTSKTPLHGDEEMPFGNLLFRREPPGLLPGEASYLTLVAHFDSKIEPEGFIGATDSAAPCAMLMYIANVIDPYLTQVYDRVQKEGTLEGVDASMGVQILFLDGEEAFVAWTDTDSVYGARALAEEWETTMHPAMSTFRTPLDQIDLFVLLDLLGEAEPKVPSYIQTTHWAYKGMATVEERLRGMALLESQPRSPFLPDKDKPASMFRKPQIGDDHQPFMQRGVPVLHMITSPFPSVWHRIEDDGEHLDMATVKDWARIVAAFTAEWLDLMVLEKP